jgi:hypothetical protein
MKRCLAVATLALGLIAFGCDDDGDDGGTGGRGGTGGTGGRGGTGGATGGTGGATGGTGGATGGTGGATGGTGGATGGTGGATGGTGGATGGTGGSTDAADMASVDTAAEAGGETAAGLCAAYVPGSGALAGIEANAFCMEYATACTFGGDMRYTNMGDCMMKYMAAATAVKTCRAGHLCNASQGNAAAKTTHCPHATGLVLAACM